jgi:hypothetical protein
MYPRQLRPRAHGTALAQLRAWVCRGARSDKPRNATWLSLAADRPGRRGAIQAAKLGKNVLVVDKGLRVGAGRSIPARSRQGLARKRPEPVWLARARLCTFLPSKKGNFCWEPARPAANHAAPRGPGPGAQVRAQPDDHAAQCSELPGPWIDRSDTGIGDTFFPAAGRFLLSAATKSQRPDHPPLDGRALPTVTRLCRSAG